MNRRGAVAPVDWCRSFVRSIAGKVSRNGALRQDFYELGATVNEARISRRRRQAHVLAASLTIFTDLSAPDARSGHRLLERRPPRAFHSEPANKADLYSRSPFILPGVCSAGRGPVKRSASPERRLSLRFFIRLMPFSWKPNKKEKRADDESKLELRLHRQLRPSRITLSRRPT